VLLISFKEDPDVVRRFVQEQQGPFAPVLLDRSGEVSGKLYGVWGPVTLYFIDRRGQLLGRGAGPREWDAPASRAFVRALLEAAATP